MNRHNEIGHRLTMLAQSLRAAENEADTLWLAIDNPHQETLLRAARDQAGKAAAGVEVALEKHGKPEPEPDDEQPMEFETQRENNRTDDDRAKATFGDRFK